MGDLDARRPPRSTTELIGSLPFDCLVRVRPPLGRLHTRTLTMTFRLRITQSRMVPPAPGRRAILYSYPPQPFSTLRPAAEYPSCMRNPAIAMEYGSDGSHLCPRRPRAPAISILCTHPTEGRQQRCPRPYVRNHTWNPWHTEQSMHLPSSCLGPTCSC